MDFNPRTDKLTHTPTVLPGGMSANPNPSPHKISAKDEWTATESFNPLE